MKQRLRLALLCLVMHRSNNSATHTVNSYDQYSVLRHHFALFHGLINSSLSQICHLLCISLAKICLLYYNNMHIYVLLCLFSDSYYAAQLCQRLSILLVCFCIGQLELQSPRTRPP